MQSSKFLPIKHPSLKSLFHEKSRSPVKQKKGEHTLDMNSTA